MQRIKKLIITLWTIVKNFYSKKEDSFVFYYLVFVWNFLLFGFFLGIGQNFISKPIEFELYTGTKGGSYALIGEEINELCSSDNKLIPYVYHTDGDVENYQRLVEHRTGHTIALNTLAVTRILESPIDSQSKLAIVLPLFDDSALHLYRRNSNHLNNINGFQEIVDWSSNSPLRIYLGAQNSGSFLLSKELIEIKSGLPLDSLNIIFRPYVNYEFKDAANEMLSGNLDLICIYGDSKMPIHNDLWGTEATPLKWNTSDIISVYLDTLDKRYGKNVFSKVKMKNGIQSIGSSSVFLTSKQQSAFFIFQFLKHLESDGSPFEEQFENVRTNLADMNWTMDMHEGAHRYFTNYHFWNKVYWIKRNCIYILIPIILIIFIWQSSLLFRISYYHKANEESSDTPRFQLSRKRMAWLVTFMILMTAFTYYFGTII